MEANLLLIDYIAVFNFPLCFAAGRLVQQRWQQESCLLWLCDLRCSHFRGYPTLIGLDGWRAFGCYALITIAVVSLVYLRDGRYIEEKWQRILYKGQVISFQGQVTASAYIKCFIATSSTSTQHKWPQAGAIGFGGSTQSYLPVKFVSHTSPGVYAPLCGPPSNIDPLRKVCGKPGSNS
jgi:hypothetical protein